MAKLEADTDIDLSDMPDDRVRTFYVQVDSLIAGLTAARDRAKTEILNRMDANNRHEPINVQGIHVADISYRQGGRGKWKVVDERAYAQWLLDHGKGDWTETVTVPSKAACADSFIRDLCDKPVVDETTGEISLPDGVEHGRGTPEGISVSYLPGVYRELLKTVTPSTVMNLITDRKNDDDDEEPQW